MKTGTQKMETLKSVYVLKRLPVELTNKLSELPIYISVELTLRC